MDELRLHASADASLLGPSPGCFAGITGASRLPPSFAVEMLRRLNPSPCPDAATARRRWRRGQRLEPSVVHAQPGESWVPGAPWSLDEVGAAAVELGLCPESCVIDGSLTADRR